MPNHRKHRANRVPKGTAPEDFWPQMRMLRQKKMVKQTPAREMWQYEALLGLARTVHAHHI